MTTPVQLHLSPESPELSRARFRNPLAHMPVAKKVEAITRKPFSSLWTSDYVDGGSAWVDFLDTRPFDIPARRTPLQSWWHVVTPHPSARVAVVRSVDDYAALARAAGRAADSPLSTRWLCDHYDALRIEEEAVAPLRELGIDYDVPCMAWFRWRFERVDTVHVPARKHDPRETAMLMGMLAGAGVRR